jgi:iron complex transport system ATP-binding protein
MMKTLLETDQLNVSLGHKPLLRNISLTIKAGQVTALLGPNGAGKSSLLKALCQSLKLDSGEISFYQRPLAQWPKAALAKCLAVLPQSSSLSFGFTVEEVVSLGLYPLSISRQAGQALVASQLARLDLSQLANQAYPNLSGGEKQRVHLARALTQLVQAPRAPLLLLDEPTSALDLAQQHKVLTLTQELAHKQGYGVIVVLHDLNQAARYADNIVVIDQGEIVKQGSPQKVLTKDTLSQVWHYDAQFIQAHNSTMPLIV